MLDAVNVARKKTNNHSSANLINLSDDLIHRIANHFLHEQEAHHIGALSQVNRRLFRLMRSPASSQLNSDSFLVAAQKLHHQHRLKTLIAELKLKFETDSPYLGTVLKSNKNPNLIARYDSFFPKLAHLKLSNQARQYKFAQLQKLQLEYNARLTLVSEKLSSPNNLSPKEISTLYEEKTNLDSETWQLSEQEQHLLLAQKHDEVQFKQLIDQLNHLIPIMIRLHEIY